MLPMAPPLVIFPWLCDVGSRGPLSLESFPSQNVPPAAPKELVVRTPPVVVMIGRFAVLPIAPPLVIFPWLWAAGGRLLSRRGSSPLTTWPERAVPPAAAGTSRAAAVPRVG